MGESALGADGTEPEEKLAEPPADEDEGMGGGGGLLAAVRKNKSKKAKKGKQTNDFVEGEDPAQEDKQEEANGDFANNQPEEGNPDDEDDVFAGKNQKTAKAAAAAAKAEQPEEPSGEFRVKSKKEKEKEKKEKEKQRKREQVRTSKSLCHAVDFDTNGITFLSRPLARRSLETTRNNPLGLLLSPRKNPHPRLPPLLALIPLPRSLPRRRRRFLLIWPLSRDSRKPFASSVKKRSAFELRRRLS